MAGVKPLLETVGALLPKIKAWHASPHDFDKFDLSKIGTGQGAASYGPGIYAAESPKVSGVGGEYWKEFAGHFTGSGPGVDPVMSHAVQYLEHLGGDRKAALAMVNEAIGRSHNAPQLPRLQEVRDLLASDKQVGPRVYELGIKAKPDDFLQWDEMLGSQPHITKKVPQLLDAAKEEAYSRVLSATSKARQDQLYDMVKNPEYATGEFAFRSGGPDKTMDAMRDAGIPGIRYADAASRTPVAAQSAYEHLARQRVNLHEAETKGAPAWEVQHYRDMVEKADRQIRDEVARYPRTYNYVVNNPDIIEIMRKLAIPGMVGGAASVYQPQGSQ